ncbi:unnamed protein product [Strongylus vulgaris]|uniref:Uncharacterized protein n=1 Tax=Strongylus vulgaris TaxID=40348 RepID=A0A3P7LFV2_STRVU|nr:unnamed protein product [Strongylus vulgaris]
MDEDVIVEGTGLTKSWLKDRIETKLRHRPRVAKVEPLGPEALGYMSIIRRVHLEWDCNQKDLPNSVVVKIPSPSKGTETFEKSSGAKTSEEEKKRMQEIPHETETKFYRTVQNGLLLR